jgi:diguanylate cyclase (GGDEF)-like protein/PAS domain S-box-containing protein
LISSEIFQQLVQRTNDLIVVTLAAPIDPPGPIVSYVNPAFTALTGYAPDEIIGQSTRLLHGPDTDTDTVARVCAAMQARKPIRAELLCYSKSGEPVWLDINVVPLRDGSGQVTHFATIERDLTATKRLQDELSRLASTDTLTGLNNRRKLLEQAEAEFARARRYERDLAVVMLDVDHFKLINDNHGHFAGDQVLATLAHYTRGLLRSTDVIGRWGGEEFVILMPETPLAGAAAFAERLREELAALPVANNGEPLRFTVSAGVTARGEDDESVTGMLQRADVALYAAKNAGRDCVHVLAAPDSCAA